MGSFLQQFYDAAPHIPSEVIVQHEPEDAEALRQWLDKKKPRGAGWPRLIREW